MDLYLGANVTFEYISLVVSCLVFALKQS